MGCRCGVAEEVVIGWRSSVEKVIMCRCGGRSRRSGAAACLPPAEEIIITAVAFRELRECTHIVRRFSRCCWVVVKAKHLAEHSTAVARRAIVHARGEEIIKRGVGRGEVNLTCGPASNHTWPPSIVVAASVVPQQLQLTTAARCADRGCHGRGGCDSTSR